MKQVLALVAVVLVGLGLARSAHVNGRSNPDGTELQVDLPGSEHKANISSRGLGCCVFRSMDHAGRWHGLKQFVQMPEWMVSKGIPGGGYPSKLDALTKQIAAERGLPVPEYVHVHQVDLPLLEAACQSGRLVSVTYSWSPTGRYSGRRIAHMVNLVHGDRAANNGRGWWVILDNNYVGERNYEWLTTEEFLRTDPSWAVICLAAPPPPLPWN